MKKSVVSRLIAWILIFVIIGTFMPADISFAKEKQTNEQQTNENNKPKKYIVVMKDKKAKDKIVAGIKNKGKIKKKDMGTLPAISVEMTQTEVNDLASNDMVDYVEPDSEVEISGEMELLNGTI